MTLKFYDLVYGDGRRFSPYCWRTRFALAHKGLEAEPVLVRITDKETIAFSGSTTVPVIVDGDTTVVDSWRIAQYLEQTYPEAPSLFGGEGGRRLCAFINAWADTQLLPAIFNLVVNDLVNTFHPEDQQYFRTTREKRRGTTFEAIAAHREEHMQTLRERLRPFRTLLADQPYVCGEAPAYGDFILAATIQWARCSSPLPVLEPDETAILDWRERMLDAFDGLARSMPPHPDTA